MKKIAVYRPRKRQFVYTLVDDEDYERCSREKIWITPGSNQFYCFLNQKDGRPIGLHRFILGGSALDVSTCDVDHINRDALDNRKGNLRCVSHSRNMINRTTTRSGVYPGVHFEGGPNSGKKNWRASLRIDGKYVLRAKFKTAEEAIVARKNAEAQHGITWEHLGTSKQHMA